MKLKESSLAAGLGTPVQHALFATTFLLMQVQGNQNPLVCLELKLHCRTTEQRKQLAQKVPHPSGANATATHRGRLYTARAWISCDSLCLAPFMRLSLTKAAYAVWSGAACRKSGSESVTGSFAWLGCAGTFQGNSRESTRYVLKSHRTRYSCLRRVEVNMLNLMFQWSSIASIRSAHA